MKSKLNAGRVPPARALSILGAPLGAEAIPRILSTLKLPPEKHTGQPMWRDHLIEVLSRAGDAEPVLLCARMERGVQRPAHALARVVFTTDPKVIAVAESNGFPVTALLIGNEMSVCEALWALREGGAPVSLTITPLSPRATETATVGSLRQALAGAPANDVVLLCTPDENGDEPRLSWADEVMFNIPGLAGQALPGEEAHVVIGDPWLRETLELRGAKIVGRMPAAAGCS